MRLLTMRDLAKRWQCSIRTVSRYLDHGLKATMFCRRRPLFTLESVEEFERKMTFPNRESAMEYFYNLSKSESE